DPRHLDVLERARSTPVPPASSGLLDHSSLSGSAENGGGMRTLAARRATDSPSRPRRWSERGTGSPYPGGGFGFSGKDQFRGFLRRQLYRPKRRLRARASSARAEP